MGGARGGGTAALGRGVRLAAWFGGSAGAVSRGARMGSGDPGTEEGFAAWLLTMAHAGRRRYWGMRSIRREAGYGVRGIEQTDLWENSDLSDACQKGCGEFTMQGLARIPTLRLRDGTAGAF